MKNTVFPHKFWRPFLDCMPQLFFRPQYVWFPVHLKGHLIPLCYETLVVNWQNWLFTLFHQSRSVLSPNPIPKWHPIVTIEWYLSLSHPPNTVFYILCIFMNDTCKLHLYANVSRNSGLRKWNRKETMSLCISSGLQVPTEFWHQSKSLLEYTSWPWIERTGNILYWF